MSQPGNRNQLIRAMGYCLMIPFLLPLVPMALLMWLVALTCRDQTDVLQTTKTNSISRQTNLPHRNSRFPAGHYQLTVGINNDPSLVEEHYIFHSIRR